MSRRAGLLLAALVLTTAGACATPARIDLPPVSPDASGRRDVGRFVWHDLVTDDVEAAKAFYGSLFGWEFDDLEGDGVTYAQIRLRGRPIGGIAHVGDGDEALPSGRWLSVMSVADVDATSAAVRAGGGTVLLGPRDNPTRGRMVLVGDPQGAPLVLLEALGGDPPDPTVDEIGTGEWLWNELWADDSPAAADFYASLVGYAVEAGPQGAQQSYRVLHHDGRPRAGVNEIPWEGVRPNWLPYVRVEDPARVARRAEELGGRVLVAPDPAVRGGSAALLMDPTGAAFAVQRWPADGPDVPGGAR